MNLSLKLLTRKHAEDYYISRTRAFSHYYHRYGLESCNPVRAHSRVLLEGFRQNLDGVYGAWQDGILVGGVQVCPPFIIGTRCHMSSLFVLDKFQKMGLGRQIVKQVEELFGDDNWELEVIREEDFLLHFYETQGYRVIGTPQKVGRCAHTVTMQKGEGRRGAYLSSDLHKIIMSA